MRNLVRFLPVAPIAALVVSIVSVDLGLVAVSPGPTKNVLPLIDIEGTRTFRSEEALLLTTVNLLRADALTAIRGWIRPEVEVVPEKDIAPRGQTPEEFEQAARSQMDQSQIAAVVVTLERLTDYPEEHGPGALVQDVVAGSPAAGRLFPGDLIVAVDDEPVEDVEQLSEAIVATRARERLTLTVEAGGKERTTAVQPRFLAGEDRPLLGVVLVENFPFEVVIDSGGIGGPSAGLMWALGVYDLLTPGDLGGGRTIAGTGEIDLEGIVKPIGGIEQKVIAAERAGVELFLLPEADLAAAQRVAEEIELMPVRTVAQAIRALERSAA